MSFVSAAFPVFLLVVWGLYRLLPARGRVALMALAGAVFYGWIDPRLLGLLALSAGLDFVLAQRVHDDPEHARRWVRLSVVANLGLLAVFKDLGFFVEEVSTALWALGLSIDPVTLSILLPPGLSFYTFQTLGYTLDVRAGRLPPERDPVAFFAFVTFFPQLFIGPIERAVDLLPQLRRAPDPTADDLVAGGDLLLWGAVQKLVIADSLAPWVERCFHGPVHALTLLAGTLGFMVQLLGDFRGYTHMARGAARLFGVRLTPNFDRPYLAPGPGPFWQRWHATLTRWMMDHAFTPLGGIRRPVQATILTMLLVGLWHGAAWTYLAFGLVHGLALAAWRPLTRRWPGLSGLQGWLLWMPILVWSMALFRSPSLSWWTGLSSSAAWLSGPSERALAGATLSTAAGLGALLAAGTAWSRRATGPSRILAWTIALLAILTFAGAEPTPFVYWAF